MISGLLGEREKAVSALQRGVSVDPENAILYPNLATAYIQLNQMDKAEATIKEARKRNLEFTGLHIASYQIAFLRRDAGGMAREASVLSSKPGGEVQGLYYQSQTAAYGGKISRARELAASVVADCRASGRHSIAGSYLAQAALREALTGNAAQARHQAQEALALSDNKNAAAVAAIALALAGDPSEAARIAEELTRLRAENSIVRFYYLPMIRAAVAMQAGDYAEAVKTMSADTRYDLAVQRGVLFTRLYPVYLRGQACLGARQAASAVEEFQKILAYPGLVVNDPIGALAHLGLGRAYALAGDSTQAKLAYREFLALWKEADPGLALLKQAQEEYQRLP
jgi:eukaryotic-like serine/threonine-protein kinase